MMKHQKVKTLLLALFILYIYCGAMEYTIDAIMKGLGW